MIYTFCINGYPQAGKDSFVELCKLIYGNCYNFSTVDFVKQVAFYCGWNGKKTDKDRKFLSDLKKILAEWDDIPFRSVVNKIKSLEDKYQDNDCLVFIHVREPAEIQRFVDTLGSKTILIRRAAIEDYYQSNSSDANVLQFNYDYEIRNDGTLFELKSKARDFLYDLNLI